MTQPQMVVDDWKGRHNQDLGKTAERIEKGNTYKDISTICIVPTRGVIPSKVVQNWMGLMMPMNQKFIRMFVIGMEVGEAYQSAFEQILAHPELGKWKYVLTLEEDNTPPPDGLLKLYESIPGYGAVGGLYFTKGEGGQPMIYGNPKDIPMNFIPQIPVQESTQECNGLGMGFTLFDLDMFREGRIEKPWFKTVQQYTPGVGSTGFTQDLYFFSKAKAAGYRFACDTRVKVGHYDLGGDIFW